MNVRRARPSDAASVRNLLTSVYREGGAFVGDGPEPLGALTARIARESRSSFYAVCEAEGVVCGWLELNRPPARRLEHVAVMTLAVALSARRLGVATRLLEAGYAWCGLVGVLKVSLNVRADNQAAVDLYVKNGFELEGREVRQIRRIAAEGDGFEDNLIMGKWLS